jgi:hypothetical protein
MSAKFSTNRQKPYLACPIDDEKFVKKSNEWIIHILQKHADEAQARGPKVCRDFVKLMLTFMEESD